MFEKENAQGLSIEANNSHDPTSIEPNVIGLDENNSMSSRKRKKKFKSIGCLQK